MRAKPPRQIQMLDLTVPVSDTSPKIREMQLSIYRAMTDEQRLRIAMEMSDCVKEIQKAGIRSLHPDWSEQQVIRELLRMTLWPEPLPESLR
jgi:Rv0078B-related antitoxin